MIAAVLLAAWFPAASLAGVVLGRAIRTADRRETAG